MTEQIGSENESQTEERKPVEKVISGEVKQRKKSLGKKMAETFTGDSIQGAGSFVMNDVIIPQVRMLIVEAGQQAIERIFLGEGGARRRNTVTTPLVGSGANRSRNSSYNSYNRYFTGGSENKPSNPTVPRSRPANEMPEIIVDTRVDAQEVLDSLESYLDQYRSVSVAVLYQMLGETPKFTDEKWGWVNLDHAGVSRVNGGFRVDLPRPIVLD